nr:MAG TPA_asm: hypothetical protein [Caudoviricetes sp.]
MEHVPFRRSFTNYPYVFWLWPYDVFLLFFSPAL